MKMISSEKTFFPRFALELLKFCIFAFAYYLPLILGAAELSATDHRAQALLDQALSLPLIQIEIIRAGAIHLALISVYYCALLHVANRISIWLRVSSIIPQLSLLTLGWFVAATANRMFFPHSDYAYSFSYLGEPSIVVALTSILATSVALAVTQTVTRNNSKRLVLLCGMLLGIPAVATLTGLSTFSEGTDKTSERNVIIVGIDSLSGPTFESHKQLMPNLTRLIDRGTYFTQAYTPIGRTFPAWTSVLTGSLPAEHGALFNLRNLKHVNKTTLLTRALQKQGYQTTFAIDERRFANIDESFSFDHVVGPKAGALDFVLQGINDTPLTNLILQIPLARMALPFSYINTASHINYDASGFVDQTLSTISDNSKFFLAAHFESAHYPFKSRHTLKTVEHSNTFLARHLSALTSVDTQVAQLMRGLSTRGHLNDALIIVMSDHGEGFGGVEMETTRNGAPLSVTGYGHGTNLLSEDQNRIVLALIQFQNGKTITVPEQRNDLVSLTDLKELIERYVASGAIDGIPKRECMITETGLRFAAASNYKTLNPVELAAESASYYEIGNDGRMQLRETELAPLVHAKDIALRCTDRITQFVAFDDRYYAYALSGDGSLVEKTPPQTDIDKIDAYRSQLFSVSQASAFMD